MTCRVAARQRLHSVSVKAHLRTAQVKQPQAACRNQNSHVQKALMEYLLLGRQPG
ncbi:hypothetical protein [Comamonas composti]|uniref:hypothetical protein n=1 Tax=Comamonas composti TaxID=408558 RepID=UPI00146FB931|nr:hypothetical protein [Comamonas composti]